MQEKQRKKNKKKRTGLESDKGTEDDALLDVTIEIQMHIRKPMASLPHPGMGIRKSGWGVLTSLGRVPGAPAGCKGNAPCQGSDTK